MSLNRSAAKQYLLNAVLSHQQSGSLLPGLLQLSDGQRPASPLAARPARRVSGGKTILVGDSLGVGTAPYLRGVKANARVGRPSREGLRELRRMHGYGQVVFDLGTNDGSAAELGRNVRKAARTGATVYVPIVHGPRAAEKNRALRQIARTHPNVRVVHWDAPLSGDGIHATPQGYRRRARQIERAIRSG